MRLKLKNFRGHDSYELTLPDTGLVLLKGISGSGKSTLLEALFDAAYGGVTKVKPWNGGSPVVEFEIPNLYIKRTHTPNTLLVKTGDREYRDDAAQAEINKLFGTKEEFLAACYIRQRMVGSLLRLGAADQLRFIQTLAFGDDDPEPVREKIAGFINETKSELKTKQFAADDAATSLTEATEKVTKAKENPKLVEPTPPFKLTEMGEIETALAGARVEDTEIRKSLSEIEAKLANPLRKKLAQFEEKERATTANIQTSKEKVVALQSELEALPEPFKDKSAEQYKAEMNLASPKRTYLKALADAQAISADVSERYNVKGPASQTLKGIIADIETGLEKLESELLQAKSDYQVFLKIEDGEACPECGTKLLIKDGKLHKHEGAIPDRAEQVQALQAKIADISEKTKLGQAKLAEARGLLSKVEYLKETLKNDPLPDCKTTEELDAYSETLTQQYTDQTTLVEKRKNLQSQIESENTSIAIKEAALAGARTEVEEAKKLPSTETLEAEKSTAWTKLTAVQGLIEQLSQQVVKITKYKAELSEWESERKVLTTLIELEQSAKAKAEKANAALAVTQADLGAWTRVKELSDKAAIEAVNATMSDINQNAQAYLEPLFPDDGTVVRLLDKNKKGGDKPKLVLDIIHKGQEVGKDINELSGGEQDRAVLAFQLAMSDMYGSPFLLVDEGFAGADAEKTLQLGLDVLKNISENKLVVVVQHGAPEGIFDEIIQL